MSKCPLRFKEFPSDQAVQDCIGAECKLHWLCNANISAREIVCGESADVGDASEDTREKLEEEVVKLLSEYPRISADSAAFLFGCIQAFFDRLVSIMKKEQAELQEQVDALRSDAWTRGSRMTFFGMDYDEACEKLREAKYLKPRYDDLQADYDAMVAKCAELCTLCGFSMVDAAGEVVS